LLLAPLPALACGIVVMLLHGGGSGRAAVNVAAGIVGSLAVIACSRRGRSKRRSDVAWPVAAAVALLLIGLTFAMPDQDGVHRWMEVGPVRLHASLLVAPQAVATVYVLGRRGYWRAAASLVAAVQVLHVLQPDAAQATGVAAAVAVLAWALRHEDDARPRPAAAVGLVGAAFAWMVPDPLRGVADVEGVFGLAFDQHPALGAAAVAAAATLTTPFMLDRRRSGARGHAPTPGPPTPIALAIGGYVAGVLLATQVGEFPVLVLGHGASTVLGYYSAAVALLVVTRRDIPSRR
jgi:hypothetical protein